MTLGMRERRRECDGGGKAEIYKGRKGSGGSSETSYHYRNVLLYFILF